MVRRKGLLVPVTRLTPPQEGERVERLQVRFRTVGDISCTCPVASDAADTAAIIAETAVTDITERGATRMDDQTSEASMERRKKEGYFDPAQAPDRSGRAPARRLEGRPQGTHMNAINDSFFPAPTAACCA